MNTIKFKTNIVCSNCIKSVTPHLNALEQIDTWHVNTNSPDKILQVTLEDSNDTKEVIEAVRKAGFEIEETV